VCSVCSVCCVCVDELKIHANMCTAFRVDISDGEIVDDLKEKIKQKRENDLRHVDAARLDIYESKAQFDADPPHPTIEDNEPQPQSVALALCSLVGYPFPSDKKSHLIVVFVFWDLVFDFGLFILDCA
jgi:hypothetical protein